MLTDIMYRIECSSILIHWYKLGLGKYINAAVILFKLF